MLAKLVCTQEIEKKLCENYENDNQKYDKIIEMILESIAHSERRIYSFWYTNAIGILPGK